MPLRERKEMSMDQRLVLQKALTDVAGAIAKEKHQHEITTYHLFLALYSLPKLTSDQAEYKFEKEDGEWNEKIQDKISNYFSKQVAPGSSTILPWNPEGRFIHLYSYYDHEAEKAMPHLFDALLHEKKENVYAQLLGILLKDRDSILYAMLTLRLKRGEDLMGLDGLLEDIGYQEKELIDRYGAADFHSISAANSMFVQAIAPSLPENERNIIKNGWDEIFSEPKPVDHFNTIAEDLKSLEIDFANDSAEKNKPFNPVPHHVFEDFNALVSPIKDKEPIFSVKNAILSSQIALSSGRSLLLVGKSGIGKTQLAKELAREIETGEIACKSLLNKHIYAVDCESLVAGTIWRGQFENRLEKIIEFVKKPNHQGMILFFENVNLMLSLGKSQSDPNGMAEVLSGPLNAKELQIIACADEECALALKMEHPIFDRSCEKVYLQNRKKEDLRLILSSSIHALEERTGQKSAASLLEDVLKEGELLENGEANPAKDMGLLEGAFGYNALICHAPEVNLQVLSASIEARYDLNLQPNGAARTRDALHQSLLGEDEAIEKVYEHLLRIEMGMAAPNRPLLSLAFFGPSGVGKTETARIIAREFCGSDKALFKIDCGQFNTDQDCDYLFKGEKGTPGLLFRALMANPRCCILIDEVEKAVPALTYNLMAMLDDGMVRDFQGRVVSAKGAIIILTSNVGSSLKVGEKKQNGFLEEETKEEDVLNAIKSSFKKEFLGRIDDVVLYRHLSQGVLEEMVLWDVEELKANAAGAVQDLAWSKKDTQAVLEQSNTDEEGARSLKKNVQKALLEKYLLESKKEGDDPS
jgi:ATP-dependent Clp protease ATP-binding subunit ClpA